MSDHFLILILGVINQMVDSCRLQPVVGMASPIHHQPASRLVAFNPLHGKRCN